MIGKFEKRIKHQIEKGERPIEIYWIEMSLQESEDGGADRCTDMLVAAYYRPDIKTLDAIIPSLQDAYANGRKVNGSYIRLPHETWR